MMQTEVQWDKSWDNTLAKASYLAQKWETQWVSMWGQLESLRAATSEKPLVGMLGKTWVASWDEALENVLTSAKPPYLSRYK